MSPRMVAKTAESPTSPERQQSFAGSAVSRRMRLTREHVSRVARLIEDPGPTPGLIYANDADYAEAGRVLLDGRPPGGEVWVFA